MPNPAQYRVTQLWTYPVKSCQGISASTLEIDERGPVGDRRWMLVDTEGEFITQRTRPRLCLVAVGLSPEGWVVNAEGMETIALTPPDPKPAQAQQVTIWDDQVDAHLEPGQASHWFSRFLDETVRLVYFPDKTRRPADQRFAPPGAEIGFADGFPFLICTQASLDELNTRLETPVPMERFRPNIVLEGGEAFDEDAWDSVEINGILFDLRSPCSRCSITTVEGATGVRSKEPLATLSAYRKTEEGVLFGQNAIHKDLGSIHVGAVARPRPRLRR